MSKSMASHPRTKKVVLQEQKKVMGYDTDFPACGIYICTSENHRDMWKGWKDAGWPIFSSWIDDKDVTAERRIYEARVSKALVLWYPDDAVPFEFLYEVGAALAVGHDVIFTGNATSHPLAAHHGVISIGDLEGAMMYANEVISKSSEERRTWFETYAGYQFRSDTRLSNAEEADVVAIWSTPEMAQKAIVLPWPNGAELAAKICEHIDASMIAGYIKGGGSSDS